MLYIGIFLSGILKLDSYNENFNGIEELDSRIEEKSMYERQIENCNENKKRLYEEYLLKKIDLIEYKRLKSDYDNKIKDLDRLYAAVSKTAIKIQHDTETSTNLINIANNIKKETSLTQPSAELLIEKIYIFPGKKLEIIWKIPDFLTLNSY